MEQNADLLRPQIPQSGRVARDTLANAIVAISGRAFRANTLSAFTDTKRQSVCSAMVMMMACAAGNVLITRQNFVVKQQLAKLRLLCIKGNEIIVGKGAGQIGRRCAHHTDQTKNNRKTDPFMRHIVLAFALIFSTPAWAEIEAARDLMDKGEFEQARKELLPAARSGNADAEELIGVMYAMGLGVERDDRRAFEWYLRSSMKGHPGAQSGVGWYYEVGRGMEAPDLVRAYMWYVLSAIGGDPDAAISQEEVVKKMTKEQIAAGNILIDDYRVWLYPFR